jgi:hypothetical protein
VPVDCFLRNERGVELAVVRDRANVLSRALPDWKDESFICLRFIDRWGNTVFNRDQMAPFIEEWRRIAQRATTDEERSFFSDVEHLAQRCSGEVHMYLWFEGD